jgi:hypothetical protein
MQARLFVSFEIEDSRIPKKINKKTMSNQDKRKRKNHQ